MKERIESCERFIQSHERAIIEILQRIEALEIIKLVLDQRIGELTARLNELNQDFTKLNEMSTDQLHLLLRIMKYDSNTST